MKIQIIFMLFCFAVGRFPLRSSEKGIPTPKVLHFDQKVDHWDFTTQSKHFQQRYLVVDDFVGSFATPLFFYTGNEGEIFEFFNNSGAIFEHAKKFRALVIFAEHRYYGESLPFGEESHTLENIRFLTIEQALRDYAAMIYSFRATYISSSVITFGGSYGGSLAAYMRMAYPRVVHGAIAASAPLLLYKAVTSSSDYFHKITQVFASYDKRCPSLIHSTLKRIEILAQDDSGRKVLYEELGLCEIPNNETAHQIVLWIRNAFTTLSMVNYPYPTDFLGQTPAWPVKVACEMMVNGNTSNNLKTIAAAVGIFYNDTKSLKCYNISEEFYECSDATGCGGNSQDINALSWDYQACTEVIHNVGSYKGRDMFIDNPWSLEKLTDYCVKKWNVVPRPDTLLKFNTNLRTSSNIVFSNGDLDPWSVGGVYDQTNANNPVIKIELAAHHLDLRGSNPKDPPSVVAARKQEQEHIANFIKVSQE